MAECEKAEPPDNPEELHRRAPGRSTGEKGAFTGASEQRKGRFEMADKGTLFLDEVGDLSPTTQANILRVLQEGEFERLGGTRTLKVDVRLIAATHKDLEQMVADGRFRQDLFFRLSVVPLHLPPLRERPEDIPALAEYFLTKYSGKNRKDIRSFQPEAMEALLTYAWPGNIRELENTVERAVILALTGATLFLSACGHRGYWGGHGHSPNPGHAHYAGCGHRGY